MWIDTHCHLQYDERGSEELVQRARDAGVDTLICVGTDLDHSRVAIEKAEQFEDVWATVALHPHDAKNGLDGIEELIGHPQVVGVGECGLDYYYEHSPIDIQREVFAEQIRWAHKYDKALMIHTRGAWDDTFEILDKEGVPPRTIIHCFTGGPEEAQKCLDRGAYISISGIVTFNKAEDIRQAVEIVPLDRLLVETDAPFLAPVPHRGKQNEPAWVTIVGEKVAELKNCDLGELAEATSANARSVFLLQP